MTEKPKVERAFVPLQMIQGNMDVLLEHRVPCTHISLRMDYSTAEPSVILMIGGREVFKDVWNKLGFQTQESSDESE